MAHPRYGQYGNEVAKAKLTDCLCPRCRKTHKAMLFWTGTCKPRVFCKDCGVVASHTESSDFYSAGATIQGRTGFAGIKI